MRVGHVVKIFQDKRYGFIRSGNLRDDVFFYFSTVPEEEVVEAWKIGEEVEFDLDELVRINEDKLRAKIVRRATRPLSVKLQPGANPDTYSRHHPQARQRKPSWKRRRNSDSSE